MDWMRFLRGTPAGDYVYQEAPYEEQVRRAADLLDQADAVLIGAGAGLSAAAGLVYGGRRFTDNFSEFIDRYGPAAMRDMYAAGFYPFPTQEERWAYWSRHAYVNRIEPPALPLYLKVFEMMRKREHFVLTTNVDHQFWKAGFKDEDIFATQGDYGLIQCAKACHLRCNVTFRAHGPGCQGLQDSLRHGAEMSCLQWSHDHEPAVRRVFCGRWTLASGSGKVWGFPETGSWTQAGAAGTGGWIQHPGHHPFPI